MADRVALGLMVSTVGSALFVVGLAQMEASALQVLGIVLMIAGFGAAALAKRNEIGWALACALAGVALGISAFYDFNLLFPDIAVRAGLAVAVGSLVAAFGFGRGSPRIASAGMAIVALGSAFWIYSDGDSWWWQLGNVPFTAGAAWTAWAAWH